MAKQNKLMEKLRSMEGVVDFDQSIYDYVIRTPSPSVNATFGGAHGLPGGYTMLLWGPAKAGKSILCNGIIGQLHQDDPEAVVVKFNTEFREKGQMDRQMMGMYGIDHERYISIEDNSPLIFDRIAKEIAALIQEGLKIKLVIIDSLSNIQGMNMSVTDSIENNKMADQAATIQLGLKRIASVQRRNGFAMILTAHARQLFDVFEQKRQGMKVRPDVASYAQHYCEYFAYVEPNQTADGKKDLMGNEYLGPGKDLVGNPEQIAHRIRLKMLNNSFGPKKRVAEFTFNYSEGFTNKHEEVFLIGVNRGIIRKPNNVTYSFDGKDYRGKGAILDALKSDKSMQVKILDEIRKRDLARDYSCAAPQDMESSVGVEDTTSDD